MNREMLQVELGKKENNGDQIAAEALLHPDLLADVIAGLSSRSPVRFKCAKILRAVSLARPELLYPQFDFFADLLKSDDKIIKWNAIDAIANLTRVDNGDKFSGIAGHYFELLNEGSLITAGHVVENSGKIARAKPALRKRIAGEILTVSTIPLPTAECRSILAGKAMETFGQYPELITNREDVIAFARSQMESARPATRKKAGTLLEQLARKLPDAQLIAPCGMNCGICHAYLRKENKCFGCRGAGIKSSISMMNCIIRNCEVIRTNDSKFCFECQNYPCRRLRQLDKRYKTKYGMSMVENLESIKRSGLDDFVEKEKTRWRCPNCGGVICVHRGYCLECGPSQGTRQE